MKTSLHRFAKASRSAYILMEVMLATGIFALAGVSLAVALSETISAGTRVQHETHVVWALESKLNEARLSPLVLGKTSFPPDGTGVAFEEETSQLEFERNIKNQSLNGLFNIKITAHWKEQNRPMDMVAQSYVYQP